MHSISHIHYNGPRVHCITNIVAANDTANILLAMGARPIMAQAEEEMGEITPNCNALLLNMGTPTADRHRAMLAAGKAANDAGIPVVVDLVGVGGSDFRLRFAKKLLAEVRCACIKGNMTELMSIVTDCLQHSGVDDVGAAVSEESLMQFARKMGCTVAVTGAVDLITDGNVIYRVHNGHPLMGQVTGSGCMLGGVIAAFLSVNNTVSQVKNAVAAMGLCGESAAERMGAFDGNATYRNYLIDSWCHISDNDIQKGANYEKEYKK